MRGQVIVACLCTLVSMGLMVIILGQYRVLILMNKEREKLSMEMKRLDGQLSELDTMEGSVVKLLNQGENIGKDVEATVAKLAPELEKSRTEMNACQGERKTKADELVVKETERMEAQAFLKPESDAWKQEINNLSAQAVGYRPICDHLKNKTLAVKICGTKEEPIIKTT